MYLAGDVGGTKTVLAVFDDQFKILRKKVFNSKKFSSLENLLDDFLSDSCFNFKRACLGVPGPVVDGVCKTTNLPWVIEAKSFSNKNLPCAFLINDFEAIGYGISFLEAKDLFSLKKVSSSFNSTFGIIGPGTGLGEAFGIYDVDGILKILPSEGGHCDFGPKNHLEIQFLEYMMQFGNVSYEIILSGKGFKHIYDFFIEIKKKDPVKEIDFCEDSAQIITSLYDSNGTCREVVDFFVSVFGSEAGNLALKLNTIGGVYLTGGITAKIFDKLGNNFLKAFHDKGKLTHLIEKVPVYVIKNEEVGLLGCINYCFNEKIF